MLMPVPRLRFYAGVGFVTAATLMLQIVETRIVSVTSWYHLAFFVISIAMFGLTAGAVWVYLRPQTYRPEHLSYHLSVASLGFALATVFGRNPAGSWWGDYPRIYGSFTLLHGVLLFLLMAPWLARHGPALAQRRGLAASIVGDCSWLTVFDLLYCGPVTGFETVGTGKQLFDAAHDFGLFFNRRTNEIE